MSTGAEDSRLHLEVTVELGGDPIRGTVLDGAGPGVEFIGWLELMSAFETVTGRAPSRRRPEP